MAPVGWRRIVADLPSGVEAKMICGLEKFKSPKTRRDDIHWSRLELGLAKHSGVNIDTSPPHYYISSCDSPITPDARYCLAYSRWLILILVPPHRLEGSQSWPFNGIRFAKPQRYRFSEGAYSAKRDAFLRDVQRKRDEDKRLGLMTRVKRWETRGTQLSISSCFQPWSLIEGLKTVKRPKRAANFRLSGGLGWGTLRTNEWDWSLTTRFQMLFLGKMIMGPSTRCGRRITDTQSSPSTCRTMIKCRSTRALTF